MDILLFLQDFLNSAGSFLTESASRLTPAPGETKGTDPEGE